jgi:hypothetical protein
MRIKVCSLFVPLPAIFFPDALPRSQLKPIPKKRKKPKQQARKTTMSMLVRPLCFYLLFLPFCFLGFFISCAVLFSSELDRFDIMIKWLKDGGAKVSDRPSFYSLFSLVISARIVSFHFSFSFSFKSSISSITARTIAVFTRSIG